MDEYTHSRYDRHCHLEDEEALLSIEVSILSARAARQGTLRICREKRVGARRGYESN